MLLILGASSSSTGIHMSTQAENYTSQLLSSQTLKHYAPDLHRPTEDSGKKPLHQLRIGPNFFTTEVNGKTRIDPDGLGLGPYKSGMGDVGFSTRFREWPRPLDASYLRNKLRAVEVGMEGFLTLKVGRKQTVFM